MTPELKLSYFDTRGRAEPTRLAFAIGGIAFEDDRFTHEAWKDIKPSTPFGQAPVLEVDGKAHAQTAAILRYAGKLTGLYPEDALTSLKVDEIVDTMQELIECLFRYKGPDKDKLREDREKVVEEDMPRLFGGTQKRLDDGVWAVGDKLSIADLMISVVVGALKSGELEFLPTDLAERYERMEKIYDAVLDVKEVREWYEKHPQ